MNPAKKNRLLVIEDDLDIQDLVVAFFRPKGFEVIATDQPSEILQAIKSGVQEFDVILTDLMLPNTSGIEIVKNLKEAENQTPMIIMTSKSTVETAIEAIESGAYDFVVKPLHFPQLYISVQRALHLKQMQIENSHLRTALKVDQGVGVEGVIGKSEGLKRALELAKRVAKSQSSVLITGESGTGKEVIAKTIHKLSDRAQKAFVAINCSAIPENLLESELFGYAKGAFTGAVDKKVGLFEEASGGTLFLDEIGDLSLPLQAKLLRVLQERQIKRVGENQYRAIDVRILSATHKDLREEVSQGKFREDLYFRLNVIPLWIPPLRQRADDILPLTEHFLAKYVALNQMGKKRLSPEVLDYFLKHPWPGNVRELENTVERAVVLSEGESVELRHVVLNYEGPRAAAVPVEKNSSESFVFGVNDLISLKDLENLYIQFTLQQLQGAKEKTAMQLGIDRKTLYRKIKEMGLPLN